MPTPIGAVLISRLAVDRAWQRRGVASALGWHAVVIGTAVAVRTHARLLVLAAKETGSSVSGSGFSRGLATPGGGFCRFRTSRRPSPPRPKRVDLT
jgi:hypothetical protein